MNMKTKLCNGGQAQARRTGWSNVVPRLLVIFSLLLLGVWPAMAKGPVHSYGTNTVLTIPQNGSTNFLFAITDDAVGWAGVTSTTASMVTNNALTNCTLVVSNYSAPYGPPPGWTNAYSLETNNLSITIGNYYGTNRIELISVDLWGDATTNFITLLVPHVSQAPAFTLHTNKLVVLGDSGSQTNVHFVLGITNGAGNPPGTWTFSTTYAASTNFGVTYTTAPVVTNYNGSNSLYADLVFAPVTRSYGSNLVTVVMTDNGGSIGGGTNTAKQQFWLVVMPVPHAPVIFGATNQTVVQNSSALTRVITVTNDAPGATIVLSATPLSTNVATASVSATNSVTATTASFNVLLTPLHNVFGTATNQMIATYTSGTNTYSTTNTLVLTITHVSQPPSFVLSTNRLVVAEESGAQTDAGFLTALSAGAGNPPGLTWTFTVPSTTNYAATNAHFAVWPIIATNGTLTFTPAAHSIGTNLITVTMSDSGSNIANGVTSFTTNFQIVVAPIAHVPTIGAVANQTTYENHAATSFTVSVSDYDSLSNNLALRAVSLNTNLATVAITGTNSSGTNTLFTVAISPKTNAFGSNTVMLIASELVGTNATTTNSFGLTVTHVTQPPSFVMATNAIVMLEQATAVSATYPNFLTAMTNGAGNPPGANWTFSLRASNPSLFATNIAPNPAIATNGTLTYTTAKLTNGTATVLVTMTDTDAGESTNNGGVTIFTNSFTLTISPVNLAAGFAIPNPVVTAPENSGVVTSNNFLTQITPGLGNAAGTTWAFAVSPATNSPQNVTFAQWPAISTNGTLTFAAATNAYGTNAVTIIMSDIGTNLSATGTKVTNVFTLQVPWVNQPPTFNLATNLITVAAYDVPVTASNTAINIVEGPSNQTNNQTVSFNVSNNNNALFTTQPAMDGNGTFTFTPGSQGGTALVQVQAMNSGGTANGGMNISSNQLLTIVIPTNSFQSAAGPYIGLFYGTNGVTPASSGYLGLTLATNGTFDGYLLCGTDSNTFAGRFSIADNSATVTSGNYALNLTINTAGLSVYGTVTNSAGQWTSTVNGYLSGNVSMDGSYLASLPGFDTPKVGSLGDSVFFANVSGGVVSLTGNLADSNQVAFTSQVCTNGFVPVYMPMYTNSTSTNGIIVGWLNLTDVANNSVSPGSMLNWVAATNASLLYPHGITNSGVPYISTFIPGQQQTLPINKGYVEMSGGDLTIPVVEAVSIVNNQIIPDPTVLNGLTLTINTNSGEVTGSFTNSAWTNQIDGVVLQNDSVARGYFLGASGQSGSFILVANATVAAAAPYPAFSGVTTNGFAGVSGITLAGITNLVSLENSPTNRLAITLYDPLTNGFTVSAVSADTSVATVAVTGGGALWNLWIAPVTNMYGSNFLVTVTADDGTLTNTFAINLTVALVNHAPSFNLSNTTYTVDKYGVGVTVPNAVTNISAGPASESWQTVNFIVSNDSSNLFVVEPAIDGNGVLTFTPGNAGGTATVTVAAQDNGGTASGGADTSADQTFTIVIPNNPYGGLLTGANNTGTFAGLFSDTNAAVPVLDRSGYFSLLLTNDGTFTGYMINAAASNVFSGQFNLSASNATATVAGYTLNLTLNPGAATVTGSVASSSPSWTATLQSYLVAAPSIAGTYNTTLPGFTNLVAGPAGSSVFMSEIDAQGNVTLTGTMADSTSVSVASVLATNGDCPIYVPLYTNNADAGLLFGWINYTNATGSSLTWFKTSGASATTYTAGFTNAAVPTTSAYVDATPNNLTGISHYVVLAGGGVGATPVTNAVTILNENVAVDPTAGDGLVLSFDDATGEVQGYFMAGGVTNYVESLILQNNNAATGYFVSADGTQCGSFALLPTFTPPNESYILFSGVSGSALILENSSATNIAFSIFDPLSTNITSLTCVSSNPAVVTATVTGSATAWTLQLTPVLNQNGTNITISLVASDDQGQSATNNLLVTVGWVNQVPSFTLNLGTYTVDKYNAPVTVSNAAINILAGPPNQTNWETISFNQFNDNSNLLVVQPAIDAKGTLTFTPGSVGGTVDVNVQIQNSGGTADGGVDTSANQVFSIVIPTNTFQNLTGTNVTAAFAGLFYDTNNTIPSSSGYFALTLTNDGTFQMSVYNGGTTNTTNGEFSISLSTANLTLGGYGVNLGIDIAGGTISGYVTNTAAAWGSELVSYLSSNSVIVPGTYTVLVPGFDDNTVGPVGYSFLDAVIGGNGGVTLTGYMADNTSVAETTALSAAGNCPVYIPLYPGQTNGLLLGWITFTNDPTVNSLTDDSSLTWYNAAGGNTNLYAGGFTNLVTPVGSPYLTVDDNANNLLGASTNSGYAYLVLSGGNLGANPVVKKMGVTNNVISVVSPTDHSVSLTITPGTGVVQGTYVNHGQTNNLEGLIFQNEGLVGGYFYGVVTNECGSFMLYGE